MIRSPAETALVPALLLTALLGCSTTPRLVAEVQSEASSTWSDATADGADERTLELAPRSLLAAARAAPVLDPTSRSERSRAPSSKPSASTSSLRSRPLPNGLFNPMPGGVMAGYRADTGLDLAGNRLPVFALAAGTLDYSEPGHTLWTGPGDTANTVRLALDEPIAVAGQQVTHVWYAHLSSLIHQQPEGATERIHVQGGEQLGVSGVANGSPHLHLGMLLDGEVSQRWGTFLLEDGVRGVLGGYRPGQRLPER